MIDDDKFERIDLSKSDEEVPGKESVVAYERPARKKERPERIKREAVKPIRIKPEPVFEIEPYGDIAPHHTNKKHYKIALAHARRSLRR